MSNPTPNSRNFSQYLYLPRYQNFEIILPQTDPITVYLRVNNIEYTRYLTENSFIQIQGYNIQLLKVAEDLKLSITNLESAYENVFLRIDS